MKKLLTRSTIKKAVVAKVKARLQDGDSKIRTFSSRILTLDYPCWIGSCMGSREGLLCMARL